MHTGQISATAQHYAPPKTALAIAIASTLVFASGTTIVNAQDANAVVEKVVVTAQKREELLKDVPMAVSAYAGGMLEAFGINNATDLRYVAPSLNFAQSANVRGEGFLIRGVGTSTFSDSVEQSVGFVVDGVVMGRSGQASGDMLDVQRVEVLRGPQGMLFGKNASAGLVSVTTKRPRFEQTTFEGKVSYANPLSEVKTQFVANYGLTPTAAFRFAFATTKADGYVENIARKESLNNRDESLLKAKGLFQISDALEVYLIADWGKKRTLCCAWTARSAPATSAFGRLNAAVGITPSPTNETIASNAPFFQNSDTSGGSAEINYDLGWATLTSLSAVRRWNSTDNNDPDLLPLNVLDINSGNSKLNQRSQEVRLTSPSGGRVEWVGGLYWYSQSNRTLAEQTGNFGGAFGALVPAGTNVGALTDTLTKNTSSAVFGQASYRLNPSIKLSGGARYTDEKIDLTYATTRTTAVNRPGFFYGTAAGATGNKNLSWRATAQWDVSKDDMAYATIARGFKGPGINTLGVTNANLTLIKPEIPTTMELGIRSSMLGGKVNTNAAIFKTKFDNFQAQIYDQNVTPGRFLVTNAGRLDTQGVEIDITARPTQQVTLGAAAAWVDAKYGEFNNIACYTGQTIEAAGTVRASDRQCIRNAAGAALTNGTGNTLSGAPRLTYNLSARYDTSVSDFKTFAMANWSWRDKTSYSAAGDPNLVNAAYGLFGASVGIAAADGRWAVSVFGKNLADKKFTTNLISQPVLNAVGVYSQFTSPDARRTVGVTVSVRLGK